MRFRLDERTEEHEDLLYRKEKRVEEGQERLEYWRGLSPDQQLAQLDKRLGEGVGAVKQRARLTAIIEKRAKAKRAEKAAKKTKPTVKAKS